MLLRRLWLINKCCFALSLLNSILLDLYNVYSELYSFYINLKNQRPFFAAEILLGRLNNIEKLSIAKPPFTFEASSEYANFYGFNGSQIDLDKITFKTNNIYLHFNHDEILYWCNNTSESDQILKIASRVKIDYPLYLFGYKTMNFEFSGHRSKPLGSNLYYKMLLLPEGSTIIDIAYTNWKVKTDIANEFFFTSLTYYHYNPYIRYINYIMTVPKEINFFIIRNDHSVGHYNCSVYNLQEGSASIAEWQINQVQNFIKFFFSIYDNLENQDKFIYFIEKKLHPESIYNWTLSFNYTQRYKELFFLESLYRKDEKIILELIKSGVNINSKTSIIYGEGNTALYLSTTIPNNINITQLLINEKADVNALNKNGNNALIPAIILGNLATIELLLLHKIDINIVERNTGNTPLHFAVVKQRYEIAEILKNHGANIYSKNVYNESSIDLACYMSDQKMLGILNYNFAQEECILAE